MIGIDPGQTGAVAQIDIATGKIVNLFDLPTMARLHGKGVQIDPYALASKLFEIDACQGGAVMEQVGPMPGQGVSGMFRFGEGVGIVLGVLGALQIPVRFVTPQKWKKASGLIGKDKDAARTLAIQMHPEVADQLTRKKDVGRADAILIARFG